MGGPGSGSWYRWSTRPVVEVGLTLDINRLMRHGMVLPQRRVRNVLHWSRQSNGERVASMGYEASLLDPDRSWLRLKYRHNDVPKDYIVPLTTTVPNYGGLRWWFMCPLSGDRVAKLYLPSGASMFGSRRAHGLAYRSQNEGEWDRMAEKAHSLRARIGGVPGFGNPMPSKPKGMHWRTFMRIRDEIWHLEHTSMMAMARKLGIWEAG